MRLTWTPVFGERLDLVGLPAGDVANVAYRRDVGQHVALAHIGGRFLRHAAGTRQAAMRRLEREIDRRSIGLLGVDVVQFEQAPACK